MKLSVGEVICVLGLLVGFAMDVYGVFKIITSKSSLSYYGRRRTSADREMGWCLCGAVIMGLSVAIGNMLSK